MSVPPPPAPVPATLTGLVAARALDAPTAALAWLLLERGIPVLVAGQGAVGDLRAAVVDAVAGALLPERRTDQAAGGDRLVRVAGVLGPATQAGILRAALAATTGRSGLVAAVEAVDLAGVLDVLARQGLSADESSFLGTVLILGAAGTDAHPRLLVAHYLRPVVRDAGGHPRRLGPAVLAAWDERAGAWEDFAWGIVPELAERARMRAGDLEAEQARRAALLAGLVDAGRLDAAALDAAARHLAAGNEAVGGRPA